MAAGKAVHWTSNWLSLCKSGGWRVRLCGTRQFGYLAGTPERYLQTFGGYYAPTEVRRRHAEAGRSAHSVAFWTALGRTIADAKCLVFIAGLGDMLQAVAPFSALVQTVHMLPSEKQGAFQSMDERLTTLALVMNDLLAQMRFVRWAFGYVNNRSLEKFWSVWCQHKLRSSYPLLAGFFSRVCWQIIKCVAVTSFSITQKKTISACCCMALVSVLSAALASIPVWCDASGTLTPRS